MAEDQNAQNPKGLIHQKRSLQKFTVEQFAPSSELTNIVASFWWVHWDLPEGEIYSQSNLPFPTQHLVIDPQHGTGFYGMSTGKFNYQLQGRGQVLGARFQFGACHDMLMRPMHELTDKMFPFEDIFKTPPNAFETGLLKSKTPHNTIERLSQAILSLKRPISEQAKQARDMVDYIADHENLMRVEDIAIKFDMSTRHLQRIFSQYIGVSPKWVIERYRMFEVLEALNNGKGVNLADLSAQLGYSDQAHFSKVFKTLTGETPKSYMRAQSDI